MKSRNQTLIFLHIPKTAGTTLSHILDRCYPKNQIFNFKDPIDRDAIENFKRFAEEKREAYRLIKGHFSFGFHRHLPGDSTYLTFLREPIARTLSFYYYARSHPDHYLYPLLENGGVELRTLLRKRTAVTHEFFNLQTCMIAGDEWEDIERPADREAVERAKQNLGSRFRLGLTEKFDASLRLLSKRFGWKIGSYRKRNVTRKKPSIETVDSETHELLSEANALDIELYQFACELFEAQRRGGG